MLLFYFHTFYTLFHYHQPTLSIVEIKYAKWENSNKICGGGILWDYFRDTWTVLKV